GVRRCFTQQTARRRAPITTLAPCAERNRAVASPSPVRSRPEMRAHARTGGGDANPDPVGFERTQGHWPPRTDPSPRGVGPSAAPVRDRTPATPNAPGTSPKPRRRTRKRRQEICGRKSRKRLTARLDRSQVGAARATARSREALFTAPTRLP